MNSRSSFFLILGVFLLGLFLMGCGVEPEPADAEQVVSVSIPPQVYLVERIAGPGVQVNTLVQGGESPATYQPTDRQVSQVLRSRVYFRIGVPFEHGRWLDAIRDSGALMKVVDLREGIALRYFGGCSHAETETGAHDSPGRKAAMQEASGPEEAEHDHAHEGADPHIWLAPVNLITMSRTIAKALGEINPVQADQYQARLDTLVSELEALHEELKKILSPYAGKCIFIYHPAWGYFCDAYGLVQVAIEFEGKEPSDEELSRVQEKMRATKAKVIFAQPQIAGKAVEAVAHAVGVKVVILDPLEADLLQNLRHAARTIADSFK